MEILDISGIWRYELDEGQEIDFCNPLKNDGFSVPGSTCDNKIGHSPPEYTDMNEKSVRCLLPAYEYIGGIYLQREINIPESFDGKNIYLFLERVNIASELWIDGKKQSRQIVSLCAPHVYDITGTASGVHTLTIRVDNSNLLNIDTMSSGYSPDTQSVWNGIIGKTEIRAEDIFHIERADIFTEKSNVKVRLVITSDCCSPHGRTEKIICAKIYNSSGEEIASKSFETQIYNRKQTVYFTIKPNEDKIIYWNEFDTELYTVKIFYCGDIKEYTFAFRDIKCKGRKFMLNGKQISLRGTLDCGIYPKTGYPPMDLNSWIEVMKTIKEYGLNHVRFHSWCPPEAAFSAADKVGVYILAEMPFWLNFDVCALDSGHDPIHYEYLLKEAMAISRTYGNHPSFIMFSNGNELLGDHEMLEMITTQIKAWDSRRLYTLTSNFDRTITPADDYFSAAAVNGKRIRIQTFHDVVSEHTRLCYDDAIENMNIPVVSFEVGQYCVYPDTDCINDYSGNMRPINFEVIRNEMIKKHIYQRRHQYVMGSGAMAALLYKEDIECALRTHDFGGFELLGLSDYTGQGTATVGLLDVFWKNKGIISAYEFRSFCCDIVPLFKAGRIFTNKDTLNADLDLYDFSHINHGITEYTLDLYKGSKKIYSLTTTEKTISIPLDFIKEPSLVRVELTALCHTNKWNIFVFPALKEHKIDIPICEGYTDKLDDIIEKGGRAVVLPIKLKHPIDGLFKPVFWSPAFFKTDRACGLIIDNEHKIFKNFPTETYADFQWKHPVDLSVNTAIDTLPEDFECIVEPIPNFFDNTRRSPLFEARVGKACILFCGFNLGADDISSKALRNSIAEYVNSEDFKPTQILSKNKLRGLFE